MAADDLPPLIPGPGSSAPGRKFPEDNLALDVEETYGGGAADLSDREAASFDDEAASFDDEDAASFIGGASPAAYDGGAAAEIKDTGAFDIQNLIRDIGGISDIGDTAYVRRRGDAAITDQLVVIRNSVAATEMLLGRVRAEIEGVSALQVQFNEMNDQIVALGRQLREVGRAVHAIAHTLSVDGGAVKIIPVALAAAPPACFPAGM